MGPYHAIMVHFPVALWTVASGILIFRALSDGPAARAFDRVLAPLLALGAMTGAASYLLGWFVWPAHALQATPLGRNHIMGATWSLVFWTAALVMRFSCGERVWIDTVQRAIMLGLGIVGGVVLALTGTLGGHLHGAPARLSELLHLIGLDVYQTFYVPNWTLVVAAVVTVAMPTLAIVVSRRCARSKNSEEPVR